MIEYIITIHGLFIEKMLNRNWNLSKHNIEEESSTLTLILDYFISWNEERSNVDQDEKLTALDSANYYIAPQTYENIITLVRWFAGYTACILKNSYCEKFVHVLHCNQSKLEGLFSRIRHMDKDLTDLYDGGGVQQQNIFHHLSSKQKVVNSVYPKEMIRIDNCMNISHNKCEQVTRIGTSTMYHISFVTAMMCNTSKK